MGIRLHGHYTDTEGLLGIIKSKEIWLTNIKFLNDEQEFNHTIDLIRNILKNPKIASNDTRYETVKSLSVELLETIKTLAESKINNIFTLSFSKKTDLLSQWRGYCPNNGYSIAINLNKYFKSIKSEYKEMYLRHCIYDEKTKNENLKSLLNKYAKKYIDSAEQKEKQIIINELNNEFMLLATHFKHPSFKEEAESRIIVIHNITDSRKINHRKGRFSITPYITLPFGREHIQKICIGPTQNPILAARGLESFIKNEMNLPIPEITHSSTPYRS